MQRRNQLFDNGKLMQKEWPIQTISVGNLSLGGTGKTPMIKYLISLLGTEKSIMLSRGYGRKGKKFVLVEAQGDPCRMGDEPLEIKSAYPETLVAVCANRNDGVEQILALNKNRQYLLLDDAYQHRHIARDQNILLTTYQNPFYKDHALPSGTLRESREGAGRATSIVVTKCNSKMTEKEQNQIINKIQKYSSAPVFFSYLNYSQLQLVHGAFDYGSYRLKDLQTLLVTGLANTQAIESHLKQSQIKFTHHKSNDHARYTAADLTKWEAADCDALITTEKDWTKIGWLIRQKGILTKPIFVLSVQPHFFDDSFNQHIISQLGKN